MLKELCDVKATLNYALREIAHLHERVDQLASGNRELAGKTDDFILPLRKKKDVQELEKRLRDENVAYDMVRCDCDLGKSKQASGLWEIHLCSYFNLSLWRRLLATLILFLTLVVFFAKIRGFSNKSSLFLDHLVLDSAQSY